MYRAQGSGEASLQSVGIRSIFMCVWTWGEETRAVNICIDIVAVLTEVNVQHIKLDIALISNIYVIIKQVPQL